VKEFQDTVPDADDPLNLEREGVMSDRPTGVPDDWPYPNEGEEWRSWGYGFGVKLLCLTDDPRPGWALETAHSYAASKATDEDLERARRLAQEAVEAAEAAGAEWAQPPAEAAAWCTAPAPEWRHYGRPDNSLLRYALVLRWDETRDVVAALRQYADGDARLLRLANRIEEGVDRGCCACGGEVEFDLPKEENWAWDAYGFHRNATCSQCGTHLWVYMGSGRTAPRKIDGAGNDL
jgi:hypothetical protein